MSDLKTTGVARGTMQWLRRLYMLVRGNRADARRFETSSNYWEQRYASGGNSGAGSYRELAAFKSEVLNAFVDKYHVASVIELGCGDGNQLALANYPRYRGFDVSQTVLEKCRQTFAADSSKSFHHVADYDGVQADLALSLDVIYHLVEDPVFEAHMNLLFDAASRYVIIYSSNSADNGQLQSAHVRHRPFSDWVDANRPAWKLIEHIPNRYPSKRLLGGGSFASFHIYARD